MKKLLLFAAIALAALRSNAQTETGKIVLGGNLSFNSSWQDQIKYTDISLVPSAGYFISDNLALGTGIGYSYSKTRQSVYYPAENINYQLLQKEMAFVFNPFLRKYGNISAQFKYFGQLSVPMKFGNTKGNSGDFTAAEHKINTFYNLGVTVAPGIAFFPSKNFGLEFSVDGFGYDYTKTKPVRNPSASSNDFSFNTNLFTPKVGVQFYF